MPDDSSAPSEVLNALGDPVRWTMLQEMARENRLDRSVLLDALGVSPTSMTYHAKVLLLAELIEVDKTGRSRTYVLRRDTLLDLQGRLAALLTPPVPDIGRE